MKQKNEFDNCLSWDIIIDKKEKFDHHIYVNTGQFGIAVVYWGDGSKKDVLPSFEKNSKLTDVDHIYAKPGRYTITITGEAIHVKMGSYGWRVVCVNQWNLHGYIGQIGNMYSNGEPARDGSWYSGEFNRCYNLIEIKEGCELSKTMKSAMGMFEYNYKLKSVPESFKLPNGLISAAFMFHGCKELNTLNFKKFPLPKSVKDADNMF